MRGGFVCSVADSSAGSWGQSTETFAEGPVPL
jgi:hypothetical protein